jgi:dUTPase
MAKRFYKEAEKIFIKELKKTGVVKALDIPNLQAEIEYYDKGVKEKAFFSFTEIDKLVKVDKNKNLTLQGDITVSKPDTVLIAKVNPNAIIPSKKEENACYDFYACFNGEEMFIPKGKPTLVPTGLATSMLPKYFLNLKHERGSSGIHGMAILSGVVDSGYRGEIFINITPLYKNIAISKDTYEVLETEDTIVYPYSKAIAQGSFEEVSNIRIKEISYEQLKAIPSERGTGKLGSSGK